MTVSGKQQQCDVLVAGGGPAGSAAAVGLHRLGYRVVLVSRPRRHSSIEGLSARTLDGLRAAGLGQALAAVGGEARRMLRWAGQSAAPNIEFVTDRGPFDQALLADAAAAGVTVRHGRVDRTEQITEGWRAVIRAARREIEIESAFLIEARGREAPARGGTRRKGPSNTALGRLLSTEAGRQPSTAVASFADGWAWFADTGKGRALLQIVLEGGRGALPPRPRLAGHYDRILSGIPEAQDWLGGAPASAPVEAREAGTSAIAPAIRPRTLYVGDAAFAIDPLSGQGIFEALGSGLAAVPVVNTLVRRPEDADLATGFFRERAHHTFLRQARIGRDFYRLEAERRAGSFWGQRARWPDDEPAHPTASAGKARIVPGPVIEGDFVVRREIVVTAEQPRGVWLIAEVPVADLFRLVRKASAIDAERLAERLGRSPEQIAVALAWLRHQAMIE
jgi:flavin-dependent dehydrogenase